MLKEVGVVALAEEEVVALAEVGMVVKTMAAIMKLCLTFQCDGSGPFSLKSFAYLKILKMS